MEKSKIEYLTHFLRAFNKYLIISWAILITGFAGYWFGFGSLLEKGPRFTFAQESSYEGTESVEVGDPEPIEDLEAVAEPAAGTTSPEPTESVEVGQAESLSEPADSVVPEPVAESVPQSLYQSNSEPISRGTESVEVGSSEPLVDSSSPEVSVVTEPTPIPQPTPTPYQAPVRVIEREVVREVVRGDKDDDNDDKDERRRDRDKERRSTSTPTPTPTLMPSPSTPTTTTIINGKTYDDVVRVARPGEAGAVCGGGATTIVTKTVTVCDKSEVQGQQVLAAVATPTPFPTPSSSPGMSPSPSPRASASPLPTLRPSPSPSQTAVVQVPQIRVVSGENVLTIPVRQETACPAGSTRIQENDSQIICQINAVQTQGQAQSQTKQIVLTGTGAAATNSAAPKVITQSPTLVKELPNTGLPAAALGFGSLVPLGLGLRKYSKGKASTSANSLWVERQMRN